MTPTIVNYLKKQEQPRYIINVSKICSLYFLNLFTLIIILSAWKTCLFYVQQLILLEAEIFYLFLNDIQLLMAFSP